MSNTLKSVAKRSVLSGCLVLAVLCSTGAVSGQEAGPQGWRRFVPGPNVYSRSHDSIKAAFRDAVHDASQSTVVVLSNRRRVALGTVVGADGFVITKASELEGELDCLFADKRQLEAQIIGVSREHDLALLKVEATGLTPVVWSDRDPPAIGAWLATTSFADTPHAIGIVSAQPREIVMPQAVLGIRLEPAENGPRVIGVILDSGASRARIREGDVVLKVDNDEMTSPDDVSAAIRKRMPGEDVTLLIQRGDEQKSVTATLGDINSLGNSTQAEIMESLGGPLSKRRAGFPSVLQHDTVLKPRDCGGPVVDIDGKVAGINIARASRVASFAIPASVVQSVVPRLMSDSYLVRTAKPPTD